ncbi:ABC transporter permease [Methanocella conradii]|uniref:ABC transporter permease n=1 Tax=Methanocella conradii TaxID=1175444 RepID=UPI0024B371D1|nr:ABC transporter permease subunit [Methanocella conradii]MDI6898052.1 ABC transporter permease subunit [Methanocella conradii]
MSLFGEPESISRVARLEFYRAFYNPLIVVVVFYLLFIAFVNGVGSRYFFQYFEGEAFDVVTRVGLDNVFYIISIVCTIAAMLLGVTSIVGDRSDNIFKVVLTKPLYIRDVIIGKFLGICAFILTLAFTTLATCSIMEMLFYGLPGSMGEFMLRFGSLVLLLFFECSLVSGIAMLVGLVFKNLLDSVAVTVALFFIDWYGEALTGRMGLLYTFISPWRLYFNAFEGDGHFLLTDTTVAYASWLNAALPYIGLMLLETLVVLAISCLVSIRMEE